MVVPACFETVQIGQEIWSLDPSRLHNELGLDPVPTGQKDPVRPNFNNAGSRAHVDSEPAEETVGPFGNPRRNCRQDALRRLDEGNRAEMVAGSLREIIDGIATYVQHAGGYLMQMRLPNVSAGALDEGDLHLFFVD